MREGIEYYRQTLSNRVFEELVREADILEPQSEYVKKSNCVLDSDGGVSGRGSTRVSGPGKALKRFHMEEGLQIAKNFSQSIGDIYPTRAAYLFYSSGDYAFLHHDAVQAHVTLLVGISGDLKPLIMYPSFGAVSNHDVTLLNDIPNAVDDSLKTEMAMRFGVRASPFPIHISRGEGLAIRGRRIPHARPMQEQAAVICTACYALLVPSSDWLTPRLR